jgi:hypothetical protein
MIMKLILASVQNVFVNKFEPNATRLIGGTMLKFGIKDKKLIAEAIHITAAAILPALKKIPGIGNNQTRYDAVVAAGQLAYAASYKYVYLTSIAFGGISIIAACFLGDITKFMDDHVAVVMA